MKRAKSINQKPFTNNDMLTRSFGCRYNLLIVTTKPSYTAQAITRPGLNVIQANCTNAKILEEV